MPQPQTEPELISKRQLARRAGVAEPSITHAIQHRLKPALSGGRIVADHPLVLAYIAKHHARPKHLKRTTGRPSKREAQAEIVNPAHRPTLPLVSVVPSAPPVVMLDPLAQACSLARTGEGSESPGNGRAEDPVSPAASFELAPDPRATPESARREYTDSVLFNLYTQTAGQLPEDLDDLGKLSLREVIDRCGSFEALLSATKSLKTHADYVKADVDAKRKRGTLVERGLIERTVLPYIDLTQKRILEEMPKAVTQQIIARVLSGGDDLAIDVQTLIHDAASSVYRDCKQATITALGGIG